MFISDGVPEIVIGDPGRFRQIITNLMGNSIKVSSCFVVNCKPMLVTGQSMSHVID